MRNRNTPLPIYIFLFRFFKIHLLHAVYHLDKLDDAEYTKDEILTCLKKNKTTYLGEAVFIESGDTSESCSDNETNDESEDHIERSTPLLIKRRKLC